MTATAKPRDVKALVIDIDYFAGEIIKRCEALHRHRATRGWNQAAWIIRRLRLFARQQLRLERQQS